MRNPRHRDVTRTVRGVHALDEVFGDSWRNLNRETARKDAERAQAFGVPCSQPDRDQLACVTVEIRGHDQLVCRDCARRAM